MKMKDFDRMIRGNKRKKYVILLREMADGQRTLFMTKDRKIIRRRKEKEGYALEGDVIIIRDVLGEELGRIGRLVEDPDMNNRRYFVKVFYGNTDIVGSFDKMKYTIERAGRKERLAFEELENTMEAIKVAEKI